MNQIKRLFLRRENGTGEPDPKGLWVIVVVWSMTTYKISPRLGNGWAKKSSAVKNLHKELGRLGENPHRWCPIPTLSKSDLEFWGRLEMPS